ncbi:hypothetical protein KCU62_g145, partial [Aureobasidium sp. EXF-3399]
MLPLVIPWMLSRKIFLSYVSRVAHLAMIYPWHLYPARLDGQHGAEKGNDDHAAGYHTGAAESQSGRKVSCLFSTSRPSLEISSGGCFLPIRGTLHRQSYAHNVFSHENKL